VGRSHPPFLQFDLQPLAECLLAVYDLDGHIGRVGVIIGDEAEALGPPIFLVSHNSHRDYLAKLELFKEVEKVKVT
jgi:hypothetical protein